ncbi:hypothetical protein K440DRAFT_95055 [Wilcoxina mikolae CBS 423.85]|nr:hypothetical protein K440DRAFT_95055 [Wilcoxina mikolae CBS 423.85]
MKHAQLKEHCLFKVIPRIASPAKGNTSTALCVYIQFKIPLRLRQTVLSVGSEKVCKTLTLTYCDVKIPNVSGYSRIYITRLARNPSRTNTGLSTVDRAERGANPLDLLVSLPLSPSVSLCLSLPNIKR